MRKLFILVAAVTATVFSACTIKSQEAPALSGPSTFAKDLNLKASPDILTQNGSDRSTISVEAKGPNGKGIEMVLRAEIQVNGITQDFGSLSSKRRSTDSAGKTEFIYSVPAAPAAGATAIVQLVTIAVTPEGTDFGGEFTRSVDIRLLPSGVIGPSNPALVAAFVVTPTPPLTAFATATFDASTSTNQGTACLAACSYAWNFGDGTTGTGLKTTHDFRSSGVKSVSLTVTDSLGATAVAIQSITVNPSTPPSTPVIVFSPSPATVNQDIFFTGTSTPPIAGRTIVSYQWSFGDGESGSGSTVTHRYRATGSYQVQLTVTDDVGSIASAVKSVDLVAVGPSADLTFLPTAPSVGQPVFFEAGGSKPANGASIVSYTWNWGDPKNPTETTAGPTQSHVFLAPGVFVVTVTVTDSAGRTASKAVTVTVSPVTPTATFTFLPAAPNVGDTVSFDGTGSFSPSATITNYSWSFGDGSSGTGATVSKSYVTAGSKTVTLTVTDSQGRTGTKSLSVTVK